MSQRRLSAGRAGRGAARDHHAAAPRPPASRAAGPTSGPAPIRSAPAYGHDLRRIRVAPPAGTPAASATAPIQAHGPIQLRGWRDYLPSRSTLTAAAVGIGTGLLAGTGYGLLAGAGTLGATALYRRYYRDHYQAQGLAHRVGELERYRHQAGEGAAGRLAGQYQTLHEIEREAHAWLRTRNRGAGEADRRAMHAVLERVDAHRRTLVGHTLQGAHPLWLPDDVGGHEAERARGLWDSIRQGAGNIKIQNVDDGGGFRTNVLTDVSKLLQSRHGRDMLSDLDADQHGNAGREVRIGADWSGVYDEDGAGSWARPIDDSAAAVSPAEGETGAGAGSHVQIAYGDPAGALAGEHDQPLHQPSYITLGHELGHARRNLLGRKRQVGHWGRAGDPTGPHQVVENAERELWSRDPEEFENITQEENPLRTELGLPERRYHRGLAAVVMSRKKTGIRLRYERAVERLGPDAEDLPAHETASRWALGYPVGEQGLTWNSPDALGHAERAIAAFEREADAAYRRR